MSIPSSWKEILKLGLIKKQQSGKRSIGERFLVLSAILIHGIEFYALINTSEPVTFFSLLLPESFTEPFALTNEKSEGSGSSNW